MEEQNPTPDNEGASTLDRLERYLAASDAPDKPETPEKAEPAEAAQQDVETDEGARDEEQQPQLSTSDLAKYLGIDESALDLDEDGTVKVKTKVDGKEAAPKLADLIKTYQIQEHAENRVREVAKQEEAIKARQQEVEQHVQQRLQYAENLVNVAAQDLLREFQSIPWAQLEQQDPGQAALLKQKFQERQAQLRGVMHNVEQNKQQMAQRSVQEHQAVLQREAQRLPELIPEWKDTAVANKERAEIRDWALKQGWDPQEVDGLSRAHHVAVIRKAMLHDRLQSSKPAIENKVRTAPKLVKPGQAVQNTQGQVLRNLKQEIRQSGGKRGIAEYLLKSGKV